MRGGCGRWGVAVMTTKRRFEMTGQARRAIGCLAGRLCALGLPAGGVPVSRLSLPASAVRRKTARKDGKRSAAGATSVLTGTPAAFQHAGGRVPESSTIRKGAWIKPEPSTTGTAQLMRSSACAAAGVPDGGTFMPSHGQRHRHTGSAPENQTHAGWRCGSQHPAAGVPECGTFSSGRRVRPVPYSSRSSAGASTPISASEGPVPRAFWTTGRTRK